MATHGNTYGSKKEQSQLTFVKRIQMPSRTRTNLFVTNTMTTARLPTGPPWTRCFAARFAAVTVQARADTRFADTHGVAIVFARSRRTANTFPSSTTKAGAVDAITTTIAILWACSTATKFAPVTVFAFTDTVVVAFTTTVASLQAFLFQARFTVISLFAFTTFSIYIAKTTTVTIFQCFTDCRSIDSFFLNFFGAVVRATRSKKVRFAMATSTFACTMVVAIGVTTSGFGTIITTETVVTGTFTLVAHAHTVAAAIVGAFTAGTRGWREPSTAKASARDTGTLTQTTTRSFGTNPRGITATWYTTHASRFTAFCARPTIFAYTLSLAVTVFAESVGISTIAMSTADYLADRTVQKCTSWTNRMTINGTVTRIAFACVLTGAVIPCTFTSTTADAGGQTRSLAYGTRGHATVHARKTTETFANWRFCRRKMTSAVFVAMVFGVAFQTIASCKTSIALTRFTTPIVDVFAFAVAVAVVGAGQSHAIGTVKSFVAYANSFNAWIFFVQRTVTVTTTFVGAIFQMTRRACEARSALAAQTIRTLTLSLGPVAVVGAGLNFTIFTRETCVANTHTFFVVALAVARTRWIFTRFGCAAAITALKTLFADTLVMFQCTGCVTSTMVGTFFTFTASEFSTRRSSEFWFTFATTKFTDTVVSSASRITGYG